MELQPFEFKRWVFKIGEVAEISLKKPLTRKEFDSIIEILNVASDWIVEKPPVDAGTV
jgi:hypothetical protein